MENLSVEQIVEKAKELGLNYEESDYYDSYNNCSVAVEVLSDVWIDIRENKGFGRMGTPVLSFGSSDPLLKMEITSLVKKIFGAEPLVEETPSNSDLEKIALAEEGKLRIEFETLGISWPQKILREENKGEIGTLHYLNNKGVLGWFWRGGTLLKEAVNPRNSFYFFKKEEFETLQNSLAQQAKTDPPILKICQKFRVK